jgi:hypothetical protein
MPSDPLPPTMTAAEVLEREWPAIRARLIEVGAALDRVGRAPGPASDAARLGLVAAALGALANDQGTDRAERLQVLFSQPYDPSWRDALRVAEGREPGEAC